MGCPSIFVDPISVMVLLLAPPTKNVVGTICLKIFPL
jgi:hypothetical protein